MLYSYSYLLKIFCVFFFFNDTATTEIYTLSLHDALPISPGRRATLTTIFRSNRPNRYSPSRLAAGDRRAGCRPLLLAGLVFGGGGFAPCVPGWARAEAAMSAACSGWGWWSGAWPGSLLLVVAASLCLSTRQESLSRPGCICAEKERVA